MDPEIPEADGDSGGEAGDDNRRAYSPLVRRLAEEFDVDLEAIRGTGPGGRVTRSDVQQAAFGPNLDHDDPLLTTSALEQTDSPAPAGVVAAPGADESTTTAAEPEPVATAPAAALVDRLPPPTGEPRPDHPPAPTADEAPAANGGPAPSPPVPAEAAEPVTDSTGGATDHGELFPEPEAEAPDADATIDATEHDEAATIDDTEHDEAATIDATGDDELTEVDERDVDAEDDDAEGEATLDEDPDLDPDLEFDLEFDLDELGFDDGGTFTLFADVDATQLLRAWEGLLDDRDDPTPLSALVVRLIAPAVEDWPMINVAPIDEGPTEPVHLALNTAIGSLLVGDVARASLIDLSLLLAPFDLAEVVEAVGHDEFADPDGDLDPDLGLDADDASGAGLPGGDGAAATPEYEDPDAPAPTFALEYLIDTGIRSAAPALWPGTLATLAVGHPLPNLALVDGEPASVPTISLGLTCAAGIGTAVAAGFLSDVVANLEDPVLVFAD